MTEDFSTEGLNRQAVVPLPVAEIATLMSTFPARWALCGGWAVDAWLGRQSREHGDVDISVFQEDQRALFDHLSPAWHLIAHDPNVPDDTADPWTGRWLDLPGHVHARPLGTGLPVSGAIGSPNEAGFGLDIELGDTHGDEWHITRNPRVAIPVAGSTLLSPWGIPTVAPEVLLGYKALERRPQDEQDFTALRPHLTGPQCIRLRNAIRAFQPDHPWLKALTPDP